MNKIQPILLRCLQSNERKRHINRSVKKICDKSNIGILCRGQENIPRSIAEMYLLEQVEAAGRRKSKRGGRGHMNKGPEPRQS